MKTGTFFRDTDPMVTFEAGQVIFSEGEDGHEMFGIMSGAVELRLQDDVIERLGEQGVFGEMSLIDHAPRNLTAIAVEPCRLAVIDERQFLWLVHETPTFALHVMSSLAERLRALNHQGDAA
jgi:CRP-like cAMP-binding protein